MQQGKIKLVVGVTGASGTIYARVLFNRLRGLHKQIDTCGVIISNNARQVWEHEIGDQEYTRLPWPVYKPDDYFAPMASGSSGFKTMIICPCTMGTLGRIANGSSNDLMSRAADVVLKEKGRLVLVIREMPFNLIQLRNMTALTEAGAVICPASPSFYSKPDSIEALAGTVVDRVLDLAGFEVSQYRWQGGLNPL